MSHDLTSLYLWSLSSMKYVIANVLPLHGGSYGREGEVGGRDKEGGGRKGRGRGKEKGKGEKSFSLLQLQHKLEYKQVCQLSESALTWSEV